MSGVNPIMWFVLYVETYVAWPCDEQEIAFRNRRLILRPETDTHYADISLEKVPGENFEDAILLVRHFLSNIAWADGNGVKELPGAGGGGGRTRRIKNPYTSIGSTGPMYLSWMSDPTDVNSRMALAFYREGLTVDIPHYRYLSLFKIINLVHDRSPEQIQWINSALPKITNAAAKQRLQALAARNISDVGRYLVKIRRDAVAHSQLMNRPAIDPEDHQMIREFIDDTPLLKALVEYFIENELHVKSSQTLWRESRANFPP